MFRLGLKIILIFAVFMTFIGCSSSEDNDTDRSVVIDENTLRVESVALPSSAVYPNSLQTITMEISSQETISVDNNDSPVFFFFSLVDTNDENTTIWFDSDSLNLIEEGTHTYEFSLEIPYDANASLYTLNVDLGDSNVTYTSFSSPAFPILAYDGKPDIEILRVTLDLEYAGNDDEDDSITSSEINSTAISMLGGALEAIPIEIFDQNDSLEIGATVALISNMQDSADVNISACIELGSECIELPILQVVTNEENITVNPADEDNITLTETVEPVYSSVIQLGFLEANVEKTVSLDFAVKQEDVVKFVNTLLTNALTNPSSVLDANIKVSISTQDESSVNPSQNNVLSYPISFFLNPDLLESLSDTNVTDLIDDATGVLDGLGLAPSLTTPLTRGAVSGECIQREVKYKKEYEKKKYGKRFGAGAYLVGRGWIDVDGVHAKAYGSIRVRRFSDTKFRILRMSASADIVPSSFSDTGYDIELSSLGKVIYTKSNSLAESASLSEPIVSLTTEEKNTISTSSSSDTNTTDSNTTRVTTEETLLKQKRIKAVKDELKTYTTTSTTNLSLVSLERNWRVGKNIERKKTIMFAILPIVVTAGAEANIGFDASIGLDGITSITAELEPNAYIGGYMEAGVGAAVKCCWVNIDYSAGAGSYLWLISERFTTTLTGGLELIADGDYIVELKGNMHFKVRNYLSTMKGKTYAYASYWGPRKWSEPTKTDWKSRRRTKTFADWEGGKYTRTLMERNWNIFTIQIADECN